MVEFFWDSGKSYGFQFDLEGFGEHFFLPGGDSH
jgi:hypothetical protein